MSVKIHYEIFPPKQKQAFAWLVKQSDRLNKSHFYLAGGTSLALQIGHRQSVDFDFFSQSKECASQLQTWLEGQKGSVLRDVGANTIHAEIKNVKLSFIGAYKYPLIDDPVLCQTLRLASIKDIALMKLLALTHRATMRDYIDLAVIIRDHIPLGQLIQDSLKKYGKQLNPMIFLKALVSFEDIDQEMPALMDYSLAKNAWKKILIKAVKALA